MPPLGIQIDGFPNASQNFRAQYPGHFLIKSGYILVVSFTKLMGSGSHCSKIDGFPKTHRTYANGATDLPQSEIPQLPLS